MHSSAYRRRSSVAAGIAAVALVGAGALVLAPPRGTSQAAAAPALHTFGTCAEVDAWLADRREDQRGGMYSTLEGTAAGAGSGDVQQAAGSALPRSAAGAADGASAGASGAAVGASGTGTNTQEAGVDEADGAKARNGLLYTVEGDRLRILDVSGPAPVLVSTLALTGDSASPGSPTTPNTTSDSVAPMAGGPTELLLVGDRVVVFASIRPPTPASSTTPLGSGSDAPGLVDPRATDPRATVPRPTVPPARDWTMARATVIDVANPRSPMLVTSIDTPGRTIAAREHRGIVRWVTASVTRPDGLECTRIAHPGEPSGAGLIAVRSLEPAKAQQGQPGSVVTDATGVAAGGEMVYASTDRLYVATTRGGRWGPMPSVLVGPGGLGGPGATGPDSPDATPRTWVHGFDLSAGSQLRYVASGSVDGVLLNRWAMSEREGQLRLATTRTLRTGAADPAIPRPQVPQSARPVPVPVPPTDAAVTVLAERDGRLSQIGQVTGLGKGEQIKSVRWFDDLGVVMTFRQTDPLYVLDLSDPTRPSVRGELKVPGFSAYLHPIGDHRLLGVGSSATDQGRVTGVQVATFDLSDVARPRRIDVTDAPNAFTPVAGDARLFSYLPAARTAIVPGTWPGTTPAAQAPGGGAYPLTPSYGVRGFAVGGDGRLTVTGTVPTPDGSGQQVAISPTRVALVSPGWGAPATVTLLEAADGRLAQTGQLRLAP